MPEASVDWVRELDGPWRVNASQSDLSKAFASPGFDDRSWDEVRVPGHWQSSPALADSPGPVLYRRPFDTPLLNGRRAFLEIDGCCYFGDVWLDGVYLGTTEGYFAPHAFDVSAALASRSEHLLGVEVGCPPAHPEEAKRILLGSLTDWEGIDANWNPGGLWRSVRIRTTGSVRIARARVLCIEAGETTGRLVVDLMLDAQDLGDDTTARLRALVSAPDGTQLAGHTSDLTLADGDNHRRVEIAVEQPPRWWPRRLGAQPLCTLALELEHGGQRSDHIMRTTAFRDVRMRNLNLSVNGERLFVMGASHGPTCARLAEAPASIVTGDVTLALDAHLDLLRIHGHVARPELYAAADAEGLMLWQDLPLSGPHTRSVRRQATRQATEMVDLLAHHPSIVVWCAHDEPVPTASSRILRSAVPSWNRDVLDRAVARSLRKADPSRPVLLHSGVAPGPTDAGSDAHLSFGWREGAAGDLAATLRAWPSLGRWVSGFGSAAPATTAERLGDHWPPISARQGPEFALIEARVPTAGHVDFESWRDAAHAYQAAITQLQIEDLRRLRHRPTGGFCYAAFADAAPGITRAVLDHERQPKPAYLALRDACRPLLPMLDPRSGALHVVHEGSALLTEAQISVKTEQGLVGFEGDVAPTSVTFVGRVDPHAIDSAVLVIEHPLSGRVENCYSPLLWRLAATTTRASVDSPRNQAPK